MSYWIPDPRWEMPELLIPGKKPVGPVEINTDHWAGEVLDHAWIFNEDLGRDLKGRQNGTVVGTTVTQVRNNAQFTGDGTTDRIDLGAVTSADPLSFQTSKTIFARVYYNGAAGSIYPRIIDKSNGGNAANGWGIWLHVYSGVGGWTIVVNSIAFEAKVTHSLPPAGWYNLCARFDKANTNLYMDVEGVGSGSDTGAVSFPTTQTNCAIGNWNEATDREWGGEIEYIYLFDEYFSDTKMNEIWRDPYQFLIPA